jgi:hypothetical protein
VEPVALDPPHDFECSDVEMARIKSAIRTGTRTLPIRIAISPGDICAVIVCWMVVPARAS